MSNFHLSHSINHRFSVALLFDLVNNVAICNLNYLSHQLDPGLYLIISYLVGGWSKTAKMGLSVSAGKFLRRDNLRMQINDATCD